MNQALLEELRLIRSKFSLRNLINYKDKEKVYACYQYGISAWSEDGGNTMTYFTNKTVSGIRQSLLENGPILIESATSFVDY